MRYSLKQIFLHEKAKSPDELSKGAFVEVTPYLGGIRIELQDDTSNTSGFIEMKPARDGCRGAYIIQHSKAAKGFGPLLYDLALEIAGDRGITADRDSVSAAASNVWKYYFENRKDVIKKPLDDKDDPKTPPKEDDCDLSVSRSNDSISFLDLDNEIKRPWLNYVYYASGKPNLKKLKQLGKLQIDPKLLGEGFNNPIRLEEKSRRCRHKREITNENLDLDKERVELSLEVLRSNSSRSAKTNEELSGKEGRQRTKREQTERSKKVDWSKIKKEWDSEVLHPQQIDHGLFYYHKDNPDRPIAGVTFATVEWEDNKIAHINMVGVNPKWRGLGLGKALIRDLSKKYGYDNIEWGFTTPEGERLRKSMEKEMEPYYKRGYDMWGRSLKEVFFKNFTNVR